MLDLKKQSLLFRMDQGSIDSNSKFRLVDGDQTDIEIPLHSPEDHTRSKLSPSHLYLSQISSATKEQEEHLAKLESELVLDATAKLFAGDLVGLSHDGWAEQNQELEDARYRYNRLKVVPHRRWANGFSCLAFAIIGVPVALRLKTGNYATTFGACFVPILLLYYPLFMVGLNGAKMSTLPAWAVWMGNVACVLVGFALLRIELKK